MMSGILLVEDRKQPMARDLCPPGSEVRSCCQIKHCVYLMPISCVSRKIYQLQAESDVHQAPKYSFCQLTPSSPHVLAMACGIHASRAHTCDTRNGVYEQDDTKEGTAYVRIHANVRIPPNLRRYLQGSLYVVDIV